jgi:SAM-dependent methyltransferase
MLSIRSHGVLTTIIETKTMSMAEREKHELRHGKMLAASDTEAAWGWGTAAGRLRAERRAALITEGGRLGPYQRVLEIGCGTGMFSTLFAASGCHLTALDLSPDLLRKARERHLPAGRAEFVEGNFETYPFREQFDAVIGSSILHHLDMNKTTPILFQLLKPGGHLSFAEPNMLNPQVFFERKLWFIRPLFWYVSPDETAFMRGSLRRLLERTGFVDVHIVAFDWLHPAIPAEWIPVVKKIEGVFERLPGIREFAGSIAISARRPPNS